MPRRRERAQYQQVSVFERGRMVDILESGLLYRDIATRTGHAATTVMHVRNQWREAGLTQKRDGTGPRNVITARDDRHHVRMAVKDRTASSTVLNRRWEYCNGFGPVCFNSLTQSFEGWTLMPLRRLPLSRDHQRLRLQWARERRHWRAEWKNVVFSDESPFKMFYNDGSIRVRRYTGEHILRACILKRHRGPTPIVMVWGAIGYNMRSRLLRIEDDLNTNRYIGDVLQPEVMPLLQATPHGIFQQDNARSHVTSVVQAFFQR